MRLVELEDGVRDLLRAQLERTGANPQTGDDFIHASIIRYIKRSERRAFYKQIRADNSSFLEVGTLTGTGSEILLLPANFARIIELKPSATSNTYYDEKPYQDLWRFPNYVFAFLGTTIVAGVEYRRIAIKTTLEAAATVQLMYWRNYTPVGNDVDSDLHPFAIDWLQYDAAIQCMSERGDVNIKWLMQERQRIEDEDLNEIRCSSHAPQHMDNEDSSLGDSGYFPTANY